MPLQQRELAERNIVLDGTVVRTEGGSDLVAKHEQVDDLLASLGF